MDDFFIDGMPCVHFGSGVFGSAAEIIREKGFSGKKALIVTGRRFAAESGRLAALASALAAAGISSAAYSAISPNPIESEIDDGAALMNSEKCDFVIGFGGGSAMDAAKAISAVASCGGRAWEYVDFWTSGSARPITAARPVVAIPTRFGSGAEVSPFSVISNLRTKEKSVLASDLIMPRLAVVDPEFSKGLAPAELACGVTDALSHLLDTYISAADGSPVADAVTEALVRELVENGLAIMDDPSRITHHENLFYISMLALTGLGQAGRGGDFILHDLEHPLSAHFGVPHGLGLGAVFPHVMRFTAEAAPERFARLYDRVFHPISESGEVPPFESFRSARTPEEKAAAAIDCTEEFLKVLGTFRKLGEYGIRPEDAARMAEDVIRLYGQGKMYLATPRKMRFSDISEIYEKLI